MAEIVAIVEGETEQTFVAGQLAAHLGNWGTAIWPVLPGRRRNRGGIKPWQVARDDIVRTLKEGRYCTTMFDFYAMPESWPGRTTAATQTWSDRARHVESELLDDVAETLGGNFDPRQFIPYVQLHEFEALAFADPAQMATVLVPVHSHDSAEALAGRFQAIVDAEKHPEAINDSYESCPSRRIAKIVPAYKKRIHGPIITLNIGLHVL